MEIKDLLAGREKCECGMAHKCPIDSVVIGENAIASLPSLTENKSRILLVADNNTYSVCGKAVEASLGDKLGGKIILTRSGVLVPDEVAIAEIESALPEGVDLIIGVVVEFHPFRPGIVA